MTRQSTKDKPKTRCISHQSSPVCARRKLAGFADKSTSVAPTQTQTLYFGTDILGSVRNVTDKYGAVQSEYNYDAFGSPYLSNLDNEMSFGYCGKIYDNGTGLYDYGFRDYSPNNARFTTIDPIRDGNNWFAYVVNDPVNYIDPFGLESTDNSITIEKGDTLSDRTWQYNKQHGTNHTWQEIAEYNGLENPHLIFPGDVITFPTTPTPPSQPAPSAPAPEAPAPAAPAPTVPTPSVPSAPPVSTGNLSSPSGGNSNNSSSSVENGLEIISNLVDYADVVTSSLSASLNSQYINSFTNAYSNIESINCTVLNVQTSIPRPTIETPKIKSQIAKTGKVSKVINRVAWGIAAADAVYLGLTTKDLQAAGKRFVRNGATIIAASVSGGITTATISIMGGGTTTPIAVVAGWGVGTYVGYKVDAWFEKELGW